MEKLTEADLLEKTADEIRADRQAWLDRKARNRAKQADADRRYNQARRDVFNPIKDYIIAELASFNLLHFDVSVNNWFGEGIEVQIRCDENNHDEKTALRWDYKASISSDGELKKETGSWSGLQACTADQLEHLKQTVAALEKLNSMDWNEILNVKMPEWLDFRPSKDELEDETAEYDYDTELKLSQLHDILGMNKAIEFTHPKLEQIFRWVNNRKFYLQVTKLTPKNVKGHIWIERDGEYKDTSYGDENFVIDQLRLGDEIINL